MIEQETDVLAKKIYTKLHKFQETKLTPEITTTMSDLEESLSILLGDLPPYKATKELEEKPNEPKTEQKKEIKQKEKEEILPIPNPKENHCL